MEKKLEGEIMTSDQNQNNLLITVIEALSSSADVK